MPPHPSTDSLTYHRTNINLNAADVHYLQTAFGNGWTTQVREIVREWVRRKREAQQERKL